MGLNDNVEYTVCTYKLDPWQFNAGELTGFNPIPLTVKNKNHR